MFVVLGVVSCALRAPAICTGSPRLVLPHISTLPSSHLLPPQPRVLRWVVFWLVQVIFRGSPSSRQAPQFSSPGLPSLGFTPVSVADLERSQHNDQGAQRVWTVPVSTGIPHPDQADSEPQPFLSVPSPPFQTGPWNWGSWTILPPTDKGNWDSCTSLSLHCTGRDSYLLPLKISSS